MILAENGRSLWRIVMPHPTDETTKYAADELHDLIYQMSGASLPVQTEQMPTSPYEILVGHTSRSMDWEAEEDWQSLGEEGFVIRAESHRVLLCGSQPRGTLYAVYTLMEDEFGCRWFASDCSRIPTISRLELEPIYRREAPAFESREAYWRDAFDGKLAVHNKMNSNKADISARMGGHLKFHRFHHTFDEMIPVRQYFDEHPEYFSMVDGKRIQNDTQLCLTNPDVLRLCIAKVKEWIKENPDCRVFSVAQNDCFHPCECPSCAAIDREEGSHSGTMIRFVNAIADAIRPEHPEVLIHTFAYQYTRKAPKHVRPADNVIVRLCSIESCFSHPMDGSDSIEHPDKEQPHPQCASLGEMDFVEDLKNWGKITKHLYVWDYVTNFRHYLMPLPNWGVLQKNMILFKKLGVTGILEQGNFSQMAGGHFAELEAYLQSKLMWNPYCDLEAHLNDFLCAYYGSEALPFLKEYMRLWREAGEREHVSIFDSVTAPYVTEELITKSAELLGQALFMVKDSIKHRHLSRLMLSMQYLILSRMDEHTPGRKALLAIFGWTAREQGITELKERWCLEESLQEMEKHCDETQWERTIRCDYKM